MPGTAGTGTDGGQTSFNGIVARSGRAGRERQPWHVRLRLSPLAGWITLGEAADDLGISRQAVHRLVERGTLRKKDLRTVGRRPVIIVRESAIAGMPMTPQRRRELELRTAALAGTGALAASLDDELPGE